MLHKLGEAGTVDWKCAHDYSPNDHDPPDAQVRNRLRASSVSDDDINDPRALVLQGASAAVLAERAHQRLGVDVSEEVASSAMAGIWRSTRRT